MTATEKRHRIPQATLMKLWKRAWRMARKLCGYTISRLDHGEGGFYEVDDFYQDLFLAFWELADDCWRQQGGQLTDLSTLWARWRSALGHGASNILRRPPQRLWEHTETPITSLTLEILEEEANESINEPVVRPPELKREESAEQTFERLSRIEHLERALWMLSPSERQVLFMILIQGFAASKVAQRLKLPSANAVYARLFRAREKLLLVSQSIPEIILQRKGERP